MCKAEVQTLVAFVRRGCEIVLLFLSCHRVPLLVSVCVDANVEELRSNEHEYIVDTNSNKDTITPAV